MTKSVTVRLQVPVGATPYQLPEEFENYMNETYIATDRVKIEFATDEATSQVSSKLSFTTEADKVAYFNDPKVIENINARRAYNQANGIVLVDTTVS